MALNKESLKTDLKAMYDQLKTYDGSAGKTQDDAVEYMSATLAKIIDGYMKQAVITITPAHILSGALANGAGAVAAANNIIIQGGIS